MAATATSVVSPARSTRELFYTVTDVTFDNSYPTGGLAVTAAQLGLNKVNFAIVVNKTVSGSVLYDYAHYDDANAKLIAYKTTVTTNVPAQVANAADLSAITVRVIAFGTN